MRAIKIIIFSAVCLLFFSPIFGQDTTKLFKFPHKSGDMWQYFYFESNTPYVDTIQNFTIFDSIDSLNIIHITQYARSINPIKSPYLFLDTNYYSINSESYVFGPYLFDYHNLLLYKLNAKIGDQWVIEKKGLDYEIARVQNIYEGSIFGNIVSFMELHYFGARDSTDTTGLDRYTDIIADGFGLVYRASSEYFGEIHLIGAVINNILYGDTTLVSLKDNSSSYLPLNFKLNQNYPNPFNPSTTISFELSQNSNVSLIIYDVLGREICTLINYKELSPGKHKVIWNGLIRDGRTTSGIYIYHLIVNHQSLARSMILLK